MQGYRDSLGDVQRQKSPHLAGSWDVLNCVGAFRNMYLVGTAGFEPATTTPPVWCATRLRYAPINF